MPARDPVKTMSARAPVTTTPEREASPQLQRKQK
jgi:hypothetical protein